jgi:hypothetical protein
MPLQLTADTVVEARLERQHGCIIQVRATTIPSEERRVFTLLYAARLELISENRDVLSDLSSTSPDKWVVDWFPETV